MNRNLLIVDDEMEILTWLEEMFRYDFGREVDVYKANSAPEALDLLNRVKFDVVLTDIRMPAMDGIALFHRIKENWPRCRVVFFTGYRDFDNVYELTRYKEIRYILKSESDNVILETVGQVLEEIEHELEQEEIQKRRERKIEIAHYWMRKELLEAMLTGDTVALEDTVSAQEGELTQDFGVHLNFAQPFLLFLLRVDATSRTAVQQSYVAMTQELESIVQESVSANMLVDTHLQGNGQMYLFVQSSKEDTNNEYVLAGALSSIEYAQEVFRKVHDTTFSGAYLPTLIARHQVPAVANSLRQTLIGFAGGNREVLLKATEEARGTQMIPHAELSAKTPRLKVYLEFQKRKDFFELLSDFSKEMQRENTYALFNLELYYSIALQLLQFIHENRLTQQMTACIALHQLTRAQEHESAMAATQYLFDVSEALFDCLGNNKTTLTDKALARVIAYIDANLSEDLPLTLLASVGGFNASYLSRLFRQVTGMTITEYTTKKRIEVAKNRLSQTAEKVQDIAAQSGYTSPHSFARAFRNAMGISPAEYREMVRGQSEVK